MIELPTIEALAALERGRWPAIERELRRSGEPLAFDDVKNFAYSHVATAPSPATSGTSLVVTAADGTLFPTVPFNAVVWPTATNPLSSNAEIVRVTARSTDTLTITRAQEGTSARTIIVGDQIAAAVTRKLLLTDLSMIGAPWSNVITPSTLSANTDNWNPTGLATASVVRMQMTGADGTRELRGLSASGAGATDGRAILLENVGTVIPVELIHDASTSTAANRFFLSGGVAGGVFQLTAGASCLMVYDGTSSRWRVVGGGAPSGDYDTTPQAATATGTAGTSPYYSPMNHAHPLNGSWTLIGDSGVLGADAATIDFSSIPSSYANLVAFIYARTDAAGAGCYLRVNNISTATYDYHGISALNTTATGFPVDAATFAFIVEVAYSTAGANIFSAGILFIPNYADGSNRKHWTSFGGTPDTESATHSGWETDVTVGKNRANTAISRLTFGVGTFGTTKFKAGSRVTLYGVAV